jgi:hypothetical protein
LVAQGIMAEFLALRGSAAFTPARLARLQQSLGDRFPGVRLVAEHWYFVELEAPLDADQTDRLKDLLGIPASPRRSGGPPAAGHAAPGHHLALEFQGDGHCPELRLRRGEARRARSCLPCIRQDRHALQEIGVPQGKFLRGWRHGSMTA